MVGDILIDSGAVVERVTSRRELERLRPEWEALWRSLPDRTPFQHPAWACAWWDTFGSGELRVLVVRDSGRAAGIVPLYRTIGAGGAGEIRLIGAGVSDYLDALAGQAASDAVAAAIAHELAGSAHEWALCAFDRVRPGSLLLKVPAPPGTLDARCAADPCPILDLPTEPESLQNAIGKHLARNIRYARRRAQALGGVTLDRAAPDTIEEMLTTLFDLHGARWSLRGEAGVLQDDDVRAFHRAAAPGLLAAGVLRLYALRIGTRTAAAHYGFQAGTRAYYYIGGFDPEFAALSPGKLITAAALEEAIGEGATAFDFLGGREAYKYEWGAIDRPRVSRHMRRPAGAAA
jgi:CelD/BcsL family acetyltransferase involved in cellulose biosynthesis